VQSRGDNRLWHRFRKTTTSFTLCVDLVGQTYANLFGGHVELSPIYNIVLIIFVKYTVNSKYVAHLIVFGM